MPVSCRNLTAKCTPMGAERLGGHERQPTKYVYMTTFSEERESKLEKNGVDLVGDITKRLFFFYA